MLFSFVSKSSLKHILKILVAVGSRSSVPDLVHGGFIGVIPFGSYPFHKSSGHLHFSCFCAPSICFSGSVKVLEPLNRVFSFGPREDIYLGGRSFHISLSIRLIIDGGGKIGICSGNS